MHSVRCLLSPINQCPNAPPTTTQMREEKRSERRASGSTWVTDSQLLRESVREAAWSLADGSHKELPVEQGRRAAGDYLQVSGDIL